MELKAKGPARGEPDCRASLCEGGYPRAGWAQWAALHHANALAQVHFQRARELYPAPAHWRLQDGAAISVT
jgi:hypothetical protein